MMESLQSITSWGLAGSAGPARRDRTLGPLSIVTDPTFMAWHTHNRRESTGAISVGVIIVDLRSHVG